MTLHRRYRNVLSALVAAGLGLALAAPARAARIEIDWWHAMVGPLADQVNALAAGFNASQTEYKVVPVFKGNYAATLTSAIAAFRAHQQPDIVQVYEVGTATMMAAKGAIYPVYELMKNTGEPFDPKAYVPAVYSYYATPGGELLSLPFNSSTPVLFYNEDDFAKAGLNPKDPPKTWAEMGTVSQKLLAAGFKCGFTSSWQAWIQLENFSAWHNLPFATMQNGYGGLGARLVFNGPLQVAHIQQLADWTRTHVFVYGGREDKPEPLFTSNECPMLMSSTGIAARVAKAMPGAHIGIAPMPYDANVKGAPQNSIIGGATLWVLRGKPADHYKGVAEFFHYLSLPEVQAKWHQETGYVPVTTAAYDLSRRQGFYKKYPGRDVAIQELSLHKPTANSRGIRLGDYVQIRDIENEELEAVWAGKKSAKQALDEAVARGNKLLEQFQAENQ